MKMFTLIAFTLLAIGVNGGHVSQQVLSAPLFKTVASTGYVSGGKKLISWSPGFSGLGGSNGIGYLPSSIGFSGLGGSNNVGYLSSPSYSSFGGNTGYLASPGLGSWSSLGGGFLASAPLTSGYASNVYQASPVLSGSYIASAPITTSYSGFGGGLLSSAPFSSGYVSTGYQASPVVTGPYLAAAPVATTQYVQQPKIIEQNPVHHVQVVHQPKIKEVTVVRKPGQRIVKVLPATVHETRKVYNLPAAQPTGIVALGHGSRKTVENKVVVEQNKVVPHEEGGSDLNGAGFKDPENDLNLNGSYQQGQPQVSSTHTASAPSFSNFGREDTQVKYDTK